MRVTNIFLSLLHICNVDLLNRLNESYVFQHNLATKILRFEKDKKDREDAYEQCYFNLFGEHIYSVLKANIAM